MSTKAKTTRLTFGDRAAPPESGPADADASTVDSSAARQTPAQDRRPAPAERPEPVEQPPGEIGGSDRPEPTRYGDWEVGGRCTDF